MSYSFFGRYYDKHKMVFPYDYKDYSFKIDLQNGNLYFSRKLISFSGKHLPLELFLNYSEMHVNVYDNLHSYTGFPRGFKTNYHVVLEYESAYNRYIYEDMDGFKHHFLLAENSSSLYYDSFGSGLMLVVENNGYKVFDDDGYYQLFDQYGRLVTIHKRITSTHYAEQSITYLDNTSLKISAITDNYGRAISFAYDSTYVRVSYNSNIVITLSLNNYLLTKISKNIGGYLVEDTINQSSWIVTNITLNSGETFDFSYTDDQIDHFITNIKQDAFSFDYDPTSNKWAVVNNQRGISTRYDFTDSQSVSQTSENGSNLSYLKINSDIASCLIKDVNNNNEVIDFRFGVNNATSIDVASYNSGSSQVETNNYIQSKKMYLLIAEIEGNLGTERFGLSLYDYDNNLLADLTFEGNTRILAAPVGVKASTQKSFSVSYYNVAFNTITIVKVRLLPLIGDFEVLCSNVNTYGPIFFYGDTPHYLFPSGIVDKYNNTIVAYRQIKALLDDFLVNEKQFYKANGNFHFWANDKKTLFDNVSSIFVLLKYNTCLGYDLSHGKIGLYDSSYNFISNLFFYHIQGKDDNAFSIIKSSHDSSSFHAGYASFYFEKQETRFAAGNNGDLTYYDYDDNYSLNELNRDNGYKEEYDYDSNGNLVSKTISQTNVSQQIVYEYGYDSSDNLVEEEKLIGTSIEQIEYGFDSFGNLSNIDYPNQSTKCLNYDGVSGERSLSNCFVTANFNIIQNNNYIDDDSSSLSTNSNSNTYLFNYDAGKLTDVSYNNQNILSISYNADIYNGVVLYSAETVSYSNGDSIYTEFDSYNRLSITNNCLYSYNQYSGLTSITDSYYNYTYPTILYSYDYYDQITEIIHRYNNLTVSLTYDIYKRITSRLFTLNQNNLYTVSYSYHVAPTLEKVIKASTVSINSSSITINDTLDGLSRLTYQSITFGTYSFSKDITYCVNSSSNMTNYMVSSVIYSTSVNYSKARPIIDPIINLFDEDVYSYDNVGNIISITRKIGSLVSYQTDYVYDNLSRLNRENNPKMNKSYRCTYNSNGNINFKKEYAYTTGDLPSTPTITHTYSYSSTYPDRLISFDGQAISYDNVGNPVLYRGKTMYWTKGTLLSQVSEGSNYIDLVYDGLNQRVSKSANNETTNFSYIDRQLIIEERGTKTIKYLYSHQGIIGFVLSGFGSSLNGIYLYEKNIQQDVIAIRDINNNIKAKYFYDAWGNHIVCNPNGTINNTNTFIGNINPIRYRSYYYDTDLKMYWLTTRYYDPEVGRFISPDHYSYLDYQKLHGLNLYAYSKNNPVMYCDPSGHSLFAIFAIIVAAVVVAATATMKAVTQVSEIVASNQDKENLEYPTEDDHTENKDYYKSVEIEGVVYYYHIDRGAEYLGLSKTMLVVHDSWKYTKEEITKFLNWLKSQDGNEHLNVARVRNEWLWHNDLYNLGIARGSTKDVNVYFNHHDDKPWRAFFFDLWPLF